LQLLRKRRPRAEWVFCLGLLAVLVCWAFASPNGSVPDDGFHMASIICSGKQNPCEVPKFVSEEPCFGWGPGGGNGSARPDVTAACVDPSEFSLMVETDRNNQRTNSYSGGFYAVMHTLVSGNLRTMVLRMRLFNVLLSVASIGLAFWLTRSNQNISRAFTGAIVGTYVPLVLFFIPSINQTSWSMLGPTLLWVPLTLLLGRSIKSSTRKLEVLVSILLLAFCFFLSVGSKPEAVVYSVIGTVAVIALVGRFKENWKGLYLPLGILGLSGLAFMFMRRTSANFGVVFFGFGDSRASYFSSYYTIHNLPKVIQLYFGRFATIMGDTDFTAPATSWLFSALSFAVFLSIGARSFTLRKSIVTFCYFVILVSVPLVILNLSARQVGAFITTRYLWALLFGLLFLFLYNCSDLAVPFARAPIAVACMASSLAATGALFAVLRRYTVGASSTSWNLDADKLWWWGNAPISPLGLLAIAFVAQCFMFGAAYRVLTRNDGAILVGQAA